MQLIKKQKPENRRSRWRCIQTRLRGGKKREYVIGTEKAFVGRGALSTMLGYPVKSVIGESTETYKQHTGPPPPHTHTAELQSSLVRATGKSSQPCVCIIALYHPACVWLWLIRPWGMTTTAVNIWYTNRHKHCSWDIWWSELGACCVLSRSRFVASFSPE